MTSTSLLICLIAAVNGAKPPASEHHTSASPPYPIKRAGLENAPRTRSNAMGTAIPLGTATSHTIPSSTDIGNVFTKMCDTSTATGNNSIETISCFCRDGERRDLAIPSTSPYDPCPNTVAQPTTVTKTKGPQYGCTLTNFEAMGQTTDGLVVACEHCDKQRFGGPGPAGAWVQRCAGSSVTLSVPTTPHLTVHGDTSANAFVGTLTKEELSSSASSALGHACPDGPRSTCTGANAEIATISYPKADTAKNLTGVLTMNVIKAYFENDTMVDKFSDTVGMLANVTSFGDESCFNITHDPDGWLSTDEDVRVCTMIGAFVVEYYNGKSTHGASDFLWVSFSFAEDNDDDEKSLLDITGNICDKVTGGPLEVVNFLAGVFFPELAPLAIAGTGVVEVGCEAVDIYNEAKEQDIMVRE